MSQNITDYVQQLVSKLTGNSNLIEKFKKNPAQVVTELLGVKLDGDVLQNVIKAVQGKLNLDDVTKMQFADLNTWLLYDILQKADKMSMASSLELRVPFLDREMLKVALSIPAEHRVHRDKTKVALRLAASRELPQKTADMRKLGFPTPLNDWLRQDKYYNRVRDLFTSETAGELFKTDAIVKLLDDHRAGTAKNMKKIWSIYTFLVWYEEFFLKR